MIVEILLTVAQVLVFLYDVVTYPIYHALARLSKERAEKSSTPRASLVKESSETISWKRDKSRENDVYREYIIDNKVSGCYLGGSQSTPMFKLSQPIISSKS